MRLRIHDFGGHETSGSGFVDSEEQRGLSLTVIHTTADGTARRVESRLASLTAKNLDERLGLIMTEVVPFRLPLEQPRRSVEFLKQLQEGLVAQAGLKSKEILVQICVCRDTREALGAAVANTFASGSGRSPQLVAESRATAGDVSLRLGHRRSFFVSADGERILGESGNSAGETVFLRNRQYAEITFATIDRHSG